MPARPVSSQASSDVSWVCSLHNGPYLVPADIIFHYLRYCHVNSSGYHFTPLFYVFTSLLQYTYITANNYLNNGEKISRMLVVKSSVPSIILTMARGLTSIFLFISFSFCFPRTKYSIQQLSLSLSLSRSLASEYSLTPVNSVLFECVCWVAHESSPHPDHPLSMCANISLCPAAPPTCCSYIRF